MASIRRLRSLVFRAETVTAGASYRSLSSAVLALALGRGGARSSSETGAEALVLLGAASLFSSHF